MTASLTQRMCLKFASETTDADSDGIGDNADP